MIGTWTPITNPNAEERMDATPESVLSQLSTAPLLSSASCSFTASCIPYPVHGRMSIPGYTGASEVHRSQQKAYTRCLGLGVTLGV